MGCRLKRTMSTAHRISIAANRLPLCQIQVTAFAASILFHTACGETHLMLFLSRFLKQADWAERDSVGDSKLANSTLFVRALYFNMRTHSFASRKACLTLSRPVMPSR